MTIMNRPSAKVANQSSDTTYLCAADRDGNAISFIQSVFAPFGSRVIAGDTGVIMNNRLCSFGLDPSKANSLKPGKRPAHTLNTYMVFRGNEVFAVGGSPGADEQPQTNFQIIHDLVDLRWIRKAPSKRRAGAINRARRRATNYPSHCASKKAWIRLTLDGLREKGHKLCRSSSAGRSAARK